MYQNPNYFSQQNYQYYPQVQQQVNIPPLQGRVVRSENEITANDVSMSGVASFFPLADESAIIARRWNSNGTISSAIYQRVDLPGEPKQDEQSAIFGELNNKIDEVLERLDAIEKAKKPTKKDGDK